MTRSACIESLAAAIAAVNLGHPTRVAIDGVDGVGKTTLANELVAPIGRKSRRVIRASIDGFHMPRVVRYRRGAESPEGYFLDSFDHAALRAELLDPLGPGGSRRIRRAVFDYRNDRPIDMPIETASADAILVFDGVFLQRRELADLWDVRVWVEAPFEVTVARAVRRDVGTPDEIAAVTARYQQRYVPGQLMYLDGCHPRERADILVINTDFDEPGLRFRQFG